MPVGDSSQGTGRHRRSEKGRVQTIEYRRRAASEVEAAVPSTASYVGRVGALAVALGIGSAAASMPVALADTTGSAGSTGSADTSSASSATKPSRGAARTDRGSSAVSDSAEERASTETG